MDVGKRITELRSEQGLTTNRLANLCGLSQSFVRSVELGEKGITVENLRLLCDALHITLKEFFDVPDAAEASEHDRFYQTINKLNDQQKKALSAFLETIL